MREINPSAGGVGADVAQDVGELERLAEMDGIIAARRIFVAENLDAQEADDGRDMVTILFQRLKVVVALDVQIHFAALDQIIEQVEAQVELSDDGLEFADDWKLRGLIVTGAFHVGAPFGEPPAPHFHRHSFVVGHVVHFAAEGIERGHGVAFWTRQENEGEREIGRAFAGDGAAVLHHGWGGGGGGLPGSWMGGRPPVWASVGLMGRCPRRLRRCWMSCLMSLVVFWSTAR